MWRARFVGPNSAEKIWPQIRYPPQNARRNEVLLFMRLISFVKVFWCSFSLSPNLKTTNSWLWFLNVLVHLLTSNNSLKMVQQCGGASGWHFLGETRGDSCICSCFCFGCYIVSAKSSILVWVPEPFLSVSLWVCRLLCMFVLGFSWGSVAASLFGFSRCICICASLSSLFGAVCFCVDIDPWVGWVPYLFSFWLFEYLVCVVFQKLKGFGEGARANTQDTTVRTLFYKMRMAPECHSECL